MFKKVHFFDNAKNALELFDKKRDEIDLTIVEVDMPDISGIQMIDTIREKYGYNHPVIFTTAITNDDTLLKCLKLGASNYLIKPIFHQTHLKVLINVLKPIYDTKMIYNMNQELEIYKKSSDNQLLISKTNLEGVITYANDNFCKISKYSKDELLGQHHNIVRHPETKDELFENLWTTIKNGNIWSGTVQNRAKDGNSYFVEAKIFPIKDNENKIIEFICFRQNITEHVNLNNKAKDLLKKTKLNYSKIYDDSLEKARTSVVKELNDLEYIVKLERENSRNQTTKRARAESKLNEIKDEKDKEIEKWKFRIKESSSILQKMSVTNKKLTNESRQFNTSLDTKNQKIAVTQKKINDLENERLKLKKIIENRDDVIKHLEDELGKTNGVCKGY